MITLDDRVVTVPHGVVLDLGATAKAVAADRCAEGRIPATGCGVLINLGGDIATAGRRPRGAGRYWFTTTTTIRPVRWRCRAGRRWRRRAPFAVDGAVARISPSHPRPADGAVGGSGVAHASASRRKPALPPTQSARPRSCAAGERWIGLRPLVCPRGWWTATGSSTPSAAGLPRTGRPAMTDEALWALGRGTGITALAFLTVSLALGIATRSGRPLFVLAQVRRRRCPPLRRIGRHAACGAAHGAAVLRPLRATAVHRLRCAVPRRLPAAVARIGNSWPLTCSSS